MSAPWDGEVGPLERGFTSATSPEDFKGWVVGFYNEQSDELAELPETLADAQVARWQGKVLAWERPDQQRTDMATIGTKLNDQVIIKVPPAHGSAGEDGTGASGLGPAARQGHHTRADPKAAQC